MKLSGIRFHTCFKPAGTKSFRLAASKLFGYGNNAQNTDKKLLDAWVSDPGYVFFQRDQAGAEAKVVAMECRPGNLRRLFDLGIKPHVFVALRIFINQFRGEYPAERYTKVTVDQLAALPEWPALKKAVSSSGIPYDLGKKTCHASNYCMGPRTFQQSVLKETNGAVVLTFAEAQEFLAMYKLLFPEVVEWQALIGDRVKRTRLLRNLFGYPRQCNQELTQEYVRDCISWIPQSTVGTITNIAITELQDYIEHFNKDWHILNDKHDSLLVQAPIQDGLEVHDVTRMFLEKDLVSSTGVKYKMGSDFQIGRNWGKHSAKNPDGMREISYDELRTLVQSN